MAPNPRNVSNTASSAKRSSNQIEGDGQADTQNSKRIRFQPAKLQYVRVEEDDQQSRVHTPDDDEEERDSHGAVLTETLNWRQAICDALHISPLISDEDLKFALEVRTEPLSPAADSPMMPPVDKDHSYQILHRTRCSHRALRTDWQAEHIWADEPFVVKSDDDRIGSHLSGKEGVSDLLKYMDRHEASFLIIREYRCCEMGVLVHEKDRLTPQSDSAIFASTDLCNALNHLQQHVSDGINVVTKFEPRAENQNIGPWFFRFQKEILELQHSETGGSAKEIKCLLDYIETHKISEFLEIRQTFTEGFVTRRLLPYLFTPYNAYVLNHPQGAEYCRGVRLCSWPKFEHGRGNSSDLKKQGMINMEVCQFQWEFNGHFSHKKSLEGSPTNYKFRWDDNETLPISSLGIYPWFYANIKTQDMIRKRGEMIWKCRFKRYVSYHGWDSSGIEWFDSRFMIDCKAFRQVQLSRGAKGKTSTQSSVPEEHDDLGPVAMNNEEPPEGDFLLLLPSILMGYNMQDKQWKSLVVARMHDVEWDDQAFQCLVLPEDTKDVIKALVTHRVSQSKSTDLIQSKGSGLILLLHGPPGTGKTLTAESVAEHAKRPLYRVTCGDIGIQPEGVEKYLKWALSMAKAWNSVVLLDEAEVFLQERSLTDLHRNALVSVFLRVLEYYDGILILTSNRVGTLDEGFRSRIQLALEYPKLDRGSRRKVWENFIDRLDDDPTVSNEIDVVDLRKNLSELSKYELNGREIRNAINVARPLALSCGEQVDFKCLKKVIGVQRRFDQYIKDMNEGLDDEKVAREEGKR